MNHESLTAEMMQNRSIAQAVEGNSSNLTLKFQAAVEAALDKLVVADEDGKVTGFSFNGCGPGDLRNICESYRDFQTAEASRRSSMRTPPPPQINLPASLKPAGVVKTALQPAPNG